MINNNFKLFSILLILLLSLVSWRFTTVFAQSVIPAVSKLNLSIPFEAISSAFMNDSRNQGVTVRAMRDEDLDKKFASNPDLISDVRFYINVSNNTDKNLKLLQVHTGIQKDLLKNIRVEGVTGYTWIDDELVLSYLSLYPGTSDIITITGTPTISETSSVITVNPVVKDEFNKNISSGQSVQKSISGKKFDSKNSSMTNVKVNTNNTN